MTDMQAYQLPRRARARAPAADPAEAREALVGALREIAARLGTNRLTIGVFCREARVTMEHVYRHFGSWQGLCEAAGLEPTVWKTRVPDAEVFAAMRDCFLDHDGIVTRSLFERGFAYSKNLITRRWRTWRAALTAFRDWVAETEPDFPHLAALEAQLAASVGRKRAAAPGTGAPPWPSVGARPCGELLGFRALVNAPVNELGVVCAFAMVAGDLGYAIETVTAEFPDCTARRRVRGGRWETVRVEFEFRSRNFRDHRHAADGCDVVVCWEHDWPACPVEVLELRSVIGSLSSRRPGSRPPTPTAPPRADAPP